MPGVHDLEHGQLGWRVQRCDLGPLRWQRRCGRGRLGRSLLEQLFDRQVGLVLLVGADAVVQELVDVEHVQNDRADRGVARFRARSAGGLDDADAATDGDDVAFVDQCSTITPSCIASISLETFSVSISYSGSPAERLARLSTEPDHRCLLHRRTDVGQRDGDPHLRSLLRAAPPALSRTAASIRDSSGSTWASAFGAYGIATLAVVTRRIGAPSRSKPCSATTTPRSGSPRCSTRARLVDDHEPAGLGHR